MKRTSLKKILAALILLLSPLTMQAQEAYAALSNNNTVLTFYYDNQKASRSGMSIGPFYYPSNRGWDDYCKNITTVVFANSFASYTGLTSTAEWFYGCENLTTIEGIKNLNTAKVTTMWSMFNNCSSLTDLDVSSFNTGKVTDMRRMFYFCSSLESLDVSNFNTSNVTDMYAMFSGCSSLKSLDVSGFNTSNVTDMEDMFYACSSLTTIYCDKNWYRSSGLTSTGMFRGCTNLKGGIGTTFDNSHTDATYAHPSTADNPGYFTGIEAYAVYTGSNTTLTFYYDNQCNTRSGTTYVLNSGNSTPSWFTNGSYEDVTTVVFDSSFQDARPTSTYFWFSAMSNLTSISGMKEYLNTSEVTNMGYMFSGCPSLTSLDVRNFNTAKVENMRSMFANCTSLTSIYCDKDWNRSGINSNGMFSGCTSLKGASGTIYNPSKDTATYAHPDGGTSFPGYFTVNETYAILIDDGKTLQFRHDGQRPTVPTLKTYNLNTAGNTPGWVRDGSNTKITSVTFLEGFENVRPTSMHSWFEGMSNLTSISNADQLNTSEVTDMANLFKDCEGLKSLDVSGFNTENVTNMSDMFFRCSKLTTLNVSNFNTANVLNMNDMFNCCSSLKSLDVNSFNTDNVTNMSGMFSSCLQLTSLDVSNFNTANVTNMYAMFFGCSGLTTLDVSGFNTEKVTNMEAMFYTCSKLTTLNVSGFNTENVTTMNGMFMYCSGLTTIICENNWYKSEINSNNMFYGCTSLKGGNGTVYDASYTNATYAHPDEEGNPGYFSMPTYAVLSADGKTLTFYCDNKRSTRSGTTYNMNIGANEPDWFWLTDGGYANVTDVIFDSSFKDARPTSTYAWFYQMRNLTSISGMKEYLNTSEVTNMGYMFCGCSRLTDLDVSNFNTAKVENMRNMFTSCTNLTTIICENNWYRSGINSNDMFYGCKSLVGGNGTVYDASYTNATYAHLDAAGNPGYFTCKGGYAALSTDGKTLTFYYDTQRSTRGTTYDLNEPGDDPEWYGDIADITTVVFDSSFADARPISTSNWFFDISTLTNIIGIEYLNTSKVTNMSNMFYECERLTSIDLSHFDTGKVTNMNSMFGFCKSLTSLDLSSFNTENVTDMHNMFSKCSSLTSIAVGHLNTLKVTDMSYMFYGCSDLTNIDFTGSGFQTGIVTNMSGMFWGCQALTAVNLSGFDTRKVTTMNRMFQNCSSLTRLDLSIFNTENVEDIGWMFALCSSLTSLDVSNFNTSKVKNLWSVFFNCSSLRLLDLTSFNTSAVTLTTTTFSGCSNLKTVYVGDGWDMSKVTTSPGMFTACTSLVGGQGTTYDASHVDKAYAHIDGGPSNPGYFSEKPDFLLGDVNGDGSVTIADVTALVNIILGKDTAGQYNHAAADVNQDTTITIADVTALVNIILGK